MNKYPFGNVKDREMLTRIPVEKLLDYFFLQVRNLWRVDGLYFLGIEKKFGTEAATEIDADVWAVMAKIEARSLQKMFQVGENVNIPTIMNLLRKTSWALDQPFKTIGLSNKRAVLSIDRCRTQETRLSKELGEFPCKKVRFGYLKNFAQTLNPNVEVNCVFCPPDRHPQNVWCKWEFQL
jgi:hypothetical protein